MPDWLSGALSGVSVLALIGVLYRFAEWKGRVDSDRDSFRDFMSEVRSDVKLLLQRSSPTRGTSSPIHLTELGKAVSRAIDGVEWAKRLADDVSTKTKEMDAYGVQGFADGYADALVLPVDQRRVVRQVAFRHGLTESEVRGVLAIELRDVLLERAGLEAPETDLGPYADDAKEKE